jgi:hypothetical protein
MLGLQYKVIYKKGIDNRVADALSTRSHQYAKCLVLSPATPEWLKIVQESYARYPFAKELIIILSLHPSIVPNYTFKDGILCYKNNIWVGSNDQLHQQLIQALHNSAIGGHSGVRVTYRRLKYHFSWKGMKHDVQQYMQHCQVCIQAKPDRSLYLGKLQPLHVPTNTWQTITMDFIEGLSRSYNANYILVVVDKFTKYSHFISLSHPYTAQSVATAFLNIVYRFHGLPAYLKHRFKLAGISLKMSSSYHLHTDGQSERVNQCVETFLRCFVHACPRKWKDWLTLAEFWYNMSLHSTLGRSPFEALYGR